jgi:hypothetical protein
MKPARGFYDGLRGLVPCVVVTCWTDLQTRSVRVHLKVTKDCWPYDKGEEIETIPHDFVEPCGPKLAMTCRSIPPFTP